MAKGGATHPVPWGLVGEDEEAEGRVLLGHPPQHLEHVVPRTRRPLDQLGTGGGGGEGAGARRRASPVAPDHR